MGGIISIRGAVLSQFKSVDSFADTIGWKHSRARRIVNGHQEPDIDEIVEITNLLGITDRQVFTAIFFPALSTKWTS